MHIKVGEAAGGGSGCGGGKGRGGWRLDVEGPVVKSVSPVWCHLLPPLEHEARY